MKGLMGLAAVGLLAICSCAAAQRAAARDPLNCERDPNCAKYRSSYIDCSKQCVDDPECIDLCRQAQIDYVGGRPP